MKISLEWLTEFVTWIETDPQTIADRLTLSTAEVEEVEVQGALLRNCCVGEILTLRQHPNADRLKLVEVKTDKGTKTVVCGGTNLYEGMKIAFAHVGATVRHGKDIVTLEPIKIRGEASEGMICAAEELDLSSSFPPLPEHGERPVIDFKDTSFKAGETLQDALGMNDAVLHINNTAITTRPDLFSHLGFARECVALGLASWKQKPVFKLPKAPTGKTKGLTMKVDCKDLVPRYMGCLVEIDALGETPTWMKRRLEATGWRCVNLPVDITNYVAMEIGVPLHSFDAGDIEGTVHMRLSKKGEKITTLDGVERTLPEKVMILSDDAGVFDLLGIMGGLRSSTKDSTKQIYLHAASLDPVSIRRAIIGTGHRTDAATVYEKGVPPITTEQGFIRALQLMLDLIPGATLVSSIEDEGTNGKPKTITVNTGVISQAIGTDVSQEEITTILTDLEFDIEKKKTASKTKSASATLTVTAPLHRMRDISGVHDIVEEVGRIHGFDAVPLVMPMAPLQLPARDTRVHNLRDALKESGFTETVPLSFVSPALLTKSNLPTEEAVAIENPLGEETSLLQTHTLPQLLAQAGSQLTQATHELRTFQWGHVFHAQKPEQLQLTALVAAKAETDLLHDPFLQVKQAIIGALHAAGYEVTVSIPTAIPPFAHPGRTARLLCKGTDIGLVYEVHPSVRKKFDLPFRAAAATVDLAALLTYPAAIAMQKPLSQFPAVSYDVTVKRERSDELGPLLHKLRTGSPLLEQVSVADIYDGKPLTNGAYNLTLRFVYRSPERTLTEEEVKREHEKVLKMI